MKKIISFLIIFLLFSNNSSANLNKPDKILLGCNSEVSQNYLENSYKIKINKIEIDTHDYRRWTVNSINIITSNSRFVSNRFKNRFDATITITYEDNSKCTYTGRIRHHGDEKDHISLLGNSIIQSLDVHLNTGNIRGVTKFKLLRPKTRGILEDVVIQTQLLRDLNYLAPRSMKVNARINQAESIMLFQEKASKELLEFNNRREGPILEGDQKFFFKLVESLPDNQLSNWSVGTPYLTGKSIKTMLAKHTNINIVNKNENLKKMSYEALTKLNLAYLYYSNRFKDEKNNFNYFDYDLDNRLLSQFNKKNIIKLDMYNILMQSTNSHHGLSPDNRKFYWNALENYFEPINYDSNPDINADLPSTTTKIYRLPISEDFFGAFNYLENKIKNIDLLSFNKKISLSGVDISNENLEIKFKKVLKNLSQIKNNYMTVLSKDLIEHNNFRPMDNIMGKFNETLNDIDPSVYLIKHDDNEERLQRCKINLKMCEDFNFSKRQLMDLLEGELIINGKIYQYVGKHFNLTKNIKNKKYQSLNFRESKIFYEDGIKIEINENEKLINIIQNKPGSRAFVMYGNLKNLLINFEGYQLRENDNSLNLKTFPPNYPNDDIGLTGCLSFINLNVENIKVRANKSSCEDTVNFINVNGNIEEIYIENSFSDGLDVDFSNLNINKIIVSSSLNDCADFSAGEYNLNILKLKNCGDKGLSVGEKSFINLNFIDTENANIGIASKDSSIVQIDKANLKNLKTCVSAYNKKQEFLGGFIKMNNMECKNYFRKADIDVYSKIFEKNKNLVNYDYGKSYDMSRLKVSEVKGENVVNNFLEDFKTFNEDNSVNVIIEIPAGINEKWEVSKVTGSLNREFYMGKPRTIQYDPYPINYGMIPRTVMPARVGGDGDPLDILVLGPALTQGDVVKVKIIGLIKMTDFGEQDDKIIAVPINSDLSRFENLLHLKSEYPELVEKIKTWFENYKGKNVVNFIDYGSAKDAKDLVALTERYYNRFGIRPRS